MEDYLLPIETQFAVSLHATGETFVRIDAPCAGCHTTEGFQQYVETGKGPAVAQSSHIGCFACHAPHTNQDFSLRKIGATTLAVGGGSYDKGPSNTCAMCHQLRAPSPNFFAANFAGDSLTSSRFAGHHAPQSNILSGQGLYVFTDGTAYPANARHNISIPKGCVNCHMADVPSGALAGGHTFAIAYGSPERLNSKGCTCHSSMTDADAMTFVEEAQDAFLAALNDTLAPKLQAIGLLKKNSDESYSPNDRRRDGTGRRVIWTADEMGAVFNFGALLEDRSGGIHNPIYARAVLNATIAFADAHES
jgi:cytochrome c551/c552